MSRVKIFLAAMLIAALLMGCHAESADQIIGDIVVTGLTRTDHDLVLRYIPVQVGDEWSAETEKTMEEALFWANIFNPFATEISTETMTGNKVRVLIQLEDAGYLMLHPYIYTFFVVSDLSSFQLNQRIINPWGNGLSFSAGVNWKADNFKNENPGPWTSFGFDFLGANGRVYAYQYKDIEAHKKYNQQRFNLTGQSHVISMRQMVNNDLAMNYFLTYQNTDYLEDQTQYKEEYIIPALKIELFKVLWINLGQGFSLAEGANYSYGSFVYGRRYEVFAGDHFLFSVNGGAATDHTPLSFQFLAGGYSWIPLRGHEYELAGNAYLVSNMEYHKQLPVKNLLGLLSVDLGKVAEYCSDFSKADFMLDAAIGIGYNTPLGMFRLEKGFDLLDGGDTWKFWFVF